MLGQEGVMGVKTGITVNAGPCLCTSIEKEGKKIIVVLLMCKNMDVRWHETTKLCNWALYRINKIKQYIDE
jgi:D-alanyl-D-alanine carboxypeptidase (penicillin-binding protein 5/6)